MISHVMCVHRESSPRQEIGSQIGRQRSLIELVHTDLAGPMRTPSIEGHRYAQSFTDDYSGTMFVYFLKSKSDTVQATERFLADIAPYGEVKCIRSDNGTEFTSGDFQTLLTKNRIRHERSAPYSPHQNGTAERGWRTLYDMSRCLLIESGLPDKLWNYAVQTSAYVRNRCYSRRTKKTPYELFTGKVPNIYKLQKCVLPTSKRKANWTPDVSKVFS